MVISNTEQEERIKVCMPFYIIRELMHVIDPGKITSTIITIIKRMKT